MSLELKEVSKSFTVPQGKIEVLKGINLKLEEGGTTAIIGQSGSGKSTLLSLIAGLDSPTSGEVWLSGECLSKMNEEQLTRYRALHLGIVFQQFHLMPHLTALENITLPLELTGNKKELNRGKELLVEVGLEDRANHFPAQLSGGERQRIALARSLAINPSLLLADEPTGNLDEETGRKVSEMLFSLVRQRGATMVLVTHNRELAAACERRLTLKGGRLHDDLD